MPSERPRVRGDRGMVTAELAACLPVLILVLGAALGAVSVVSAQVRVQDAAREAARAAARGDPSAVRRLVEQAAPGARVAMGRAGQDIAATVRFTVRPLGGLLPAFTVSGRAVAAAEPDAVVEPDVAPSPP